MSNMIRPGLYGINNVEYSNRYIFMSGNDEFVGHDFPDTFYVDVVEEVQHLATLKDTKTGLYLTLDPMDHKVIGRTEPQILQLSSEDGEKYIIHPQDVNEVAYLKDGGAWSPIYVGPALQGNESKYWKFVPAN
ncbi:hypothetical protein BDR07DRAFT_1429938 [Suillus spraguei]|nr:hypothetical protein BDR07DRAFT_1429938 [Suillus spraguei]